MQNIKELKTKKILWINIDTATLDNLKYLKNEFNFDMEDLNDCLPVLNRQKIHIREKYTFVVLQFPLFDRASGVIKPSEVDFFISKNFIISVHDGRLTPVADFFHLCQTDQVIKSQLRGETAFHLFYKMVHKLYGYCYPILNHINLDIEKIDDDILKQPEEATVAEILNVKRNIANFQKIMQAHRRIWQKFTEVAEQHANGNIVNSFNNLISHTKDIWDYLSNYKDTVNALHETQESMTSLKINEIMKTLTIFSVIVFPLTLLAAIFGMNTLGGMPFLRGENGFWYVIGIMVLGMIFMFGYFKKRRWL